MNILITSAGRRSYLIEYFKQAFFEKGKVFASNSEYSVALEKADGYLISPIIYDNSYIDTIIAFCIENNIKAVISVFDIDLLVLAKNKNKFLENNIQLILSDVETVQICNDKWETYNFFINNSIPTPPTYIDILKLKEDLKLGKIDFPLIIKPRWGMASIGIYKVENDEELNFFYNYCKKEIFNSHLKFESNFTPEFPIIIQKIIKGQEYGLDIIADLESNYVGVFPKSKLKMRAGETDLGRTENPLTFDKYARTINDLLNVKGILSVDCFLTPEGLSFIEMNCRISGHYPLSHLAGVNLPKQLLKWLMGENTDKNNFLFEEGLYITKDLVPVILNENKI